MLVGWNAAQQGHLIQLVGRETRQGGVNKCILRGLTVVIVYALDLGSKLDGVEAVGPSVKSSFSV